MRFKQLYVMLAIVTAVPGCGEQYPCGSLAGSVSVDGKPLPNGTLNFSPLDAGPTVTANVQDGQYSIDCVPQGRVRIVFHAMRETGKTLHDKETGLDYAEMEELIPRKYQVQGIEIDVKEGSQSRDFELLSK
jgi:hypothetical protein